jgi:hypothetical protein
MLGEVGIIDHEEHLDAICSKLACRYADLEVRCPMRLRLLGMDSGKTGCPTLYATDRGTYVVRGKKVDDPEAIRDLIRVAEDEYYVEIPKGLLAYAEGDQ